MSPRSVSLIAIGVASLSVASPAAAQCVADSTNTNVNCSGTVSTGYQNSNTGVTLTTATGSSVTGPVILGPSATVANNGTITASAGSAALQAGDASVVNNLGTITSTNASAGSAGIVLGDHASVTNGAVLTAASGTNAVQFGRGGTFLNLASATAAVTGNIQYGLNLGNDVATFTNRNTSFGFTGAVNSSGNTQVDNAGLFNGSINQVATLGSVSILNEAAGTFTGTITTGDVTTVTNNGTMTLNGLSRIGTLLSPGTSFTNNGTLTIGTATSATTLVVNGGFSQGSSGMLNVSILAPSAGVAVAGATYGQIYAAGTGATASLGGTLNVTPSAGFYPTGSTYNVVVADGGVTGNFATVNGTTLRFISFVPSGVVTLSNGQQAYQLTVQRNGTYASVLAPTATAVQLAAATGFQPLVATASTTPTSPVAALVGKIDFLSAADAATYFGDLSPAGYLAYAGAMRDQTNLFHRQISQRMDDHYQLYDDDGGWHPGFWLQGAAQLAGSAPATGSRQTGTSFGGGYDAIARNFTMGAAIGYSYDKLRYNGGNLTGHNGATQVAAYGSYHAGPVFIDAIASYQFGHMSATRSAVLGTTTTTSTTGTTTTSATATDTATGTAYDYLVSGTVRIGAALPVGDYKLTPFAGVQFDHGAIRQFTETSATPDTLTVQRINANRTDLLAGFSIAKTQGRFRPYLKGMYRSRLDGNPQSNVTAYLDGDTTTAFTVAGLPAASSEADLDAGVQLLVDDGLGFYLGYQGTYRSDLKAHGLMAGVRAQF
ncbi:autotransporter domain-containing protein [Sphingomonas sp.]|uniref:autotransporter outer membrane beta-barrel domain-containing protein n=1 Tax=Sphingomonas sp. TaxID=28214 RepID=UPI0025F4BE06|nr:autotransporter outer membrane beta-barrel domain-containing protein [Sphingomonas sp.]